MRKKFLATRFARITRQLAVLLEAAIDELPDDEPHGDLPPMESAILEALQDGRPQPGKRLAKTAGYSYSARLRTCLADMCRRNLLTHCPDGYKLSQESAPVTGARPANGVNGHVENHR
jgi:hypothetical protein